MDNNVIDVDFTSECDSNLQPSLTCHVEIENKCGNTVQAINKSTAEALRAVADQIEADELDTGFHPITTPSGEQIGRVYLDYHAEDLGPLACR